MGEAGGRRRAHTHTHEEESPTNRKHLSQEVTCIQGNSTNETSITVVHYSSLSCRGSLGLHSVHFLPRAERGQCGVLTWVAGALVDVAHAVSRVGRLEERRRGNLSQVRVLQETFPEWPRGLETEVGGATGAERGAVSERDGFLHTPPVQWERMGLDVVFNPFCPMLRGRTQFQPPATRWQHTKLLPHFSSWC